MDILNHEQILQKINRLACEIAEKHTDTQEIVFCGLNERGFFIAKQLAEKVQELINTVKLTVLQLEVEKNQIEVDPQTIAGKNIVIVDDVINSGRSVMQAAQVLFNMAPNSISTAFLAKREHRNFPVKADFVGISLATTLQEHVYFDNSNAKNWKVYMK